MKINGKTFVPPPLPLRPRTPAEKFRASNAREPHHHPLSAWLKNAMAISPRGEKDTTDLEDDEVLCCIHMLHNQAPIDNTIFLGPDRYHLFMSIETPSSAGVARAYNTSPYLMLGHWIGSHNDGDAPPWTAYLTKDVPYHFRQYRDFMVRFVSGLTDIWVGDIAKQTVSPAMINWAIANAKGTGALSEVKYQRRRLIARLEREAAASTDLDERLVLGSEALQATTLLRESTNWRRGTRLRARKSI
ncbi:hypothetical protein B0H16DRAFT_1710172 [Mycena metata]|uniref:Uncharacterized protein n=1 Tax=Mycena metata TaxID=1033252 RepID=A0AAD7NYZ9_9AGAR|nr:hypothetical protein B0H16DRAFT_1710172 [Mycena metata]